MELVHSESDVEFELQPESGFYAAAKRVKFGPAVCLIESKGAEYYKGAPPHYTYKFEKRRRKGVESLKITVSAATKAWTEKVKCELGHLHEINHAKTEQFAFLSLSQDQVDSLIEWLRNGEWGRPK